MIKNKKKIKARLRFWNTNAKLKKLAGTKDYNAKIIEIETLSKFFKKKNKSFRIWVWKWVHSP